MTSHTPGPWSLLANEVISKSGDVIADVTGGEGNRFIDDEDNLECLANAHLITAAPDLLAVCRSVVKSPCTTPEGPGIRYGSIVRIDLPGTAWDALLAAVAKATKAISHPPKAPQ